MASNASLLAPETFPPNRLHEALRAGGRRMDWLAKKTGYSVFHVSRVANGKVAASDQFKKMACAALDLPDSYLFPQTEAALG